jgi:hypothetical protein
VNWSEDLIVRLQQDKLQLRVSPTKETLDLNKKISSLLERLFVVTGPEMSEVSLRVVENCLSSITFYALSDFELSELYYELASSLNVNLLHTDCTESVNLLQKSVESIREDNDYETARVYQAQAERAKKSALKNRRKSIKR